MVRLLVVLAALLAPFSAALAACPPDCSFRLGIETTLKVVEGDIEEERKVSASVDIPVDWILNTGRGSVRLGLAQPLLFSDPDFTKAGLEASLNWTPSAAFSPSSIKLTLPVELVRDRLDGDPGSGFPGTIIFIPPKPVDWTWFPDPFVGTDGHDFQVGLMWSSSVFNASINDPSVENWIADTLTIDYVVRAVPEPMSWVLILSGFGLVGCALRRTGNRKPATASHSTP
jgi:hypothetical protein